MPSPYRTSFSKPAATAASTLALTATSIPVESFDHPMLVQLGSVTVATVLAGVYGSATPALLTLLGGFSLVMFGWRWPREKQMRRVRLGVLSTTRGKEEPVCLPLSRVHRILLSGDMQPAFAVRGHGILATELPASHGRVRVVVRTEAGEVPLLRLSAAHSECIEWIPQVHRFLRAHGWERTDDDSPHAQR